VAIHPRTAAATWEPQDCGLRATTHSAPRMSRFARVSCSIIDHQWLLSPAGDK
jgi:hypothetical protein